MKRSPLLILFFTLFLDLLGFGLILPNIPLYIQHYGGNSAVGGMLMACFSGAQFIFTPIWGKASDRYGRRPLILMSLIGSAISYYTFGAAGSLTVLFIARVGCGVLTAASLPTAQAYIADVTTPEKRASGMALFGAAFGLGFALGPWLGGLLGHYSLFGQPPLATPAYFAALLSLANFVWAYFALPESHFPQKNADPAAKAASKNRGLLDIFPTIIKALEKPQFRTQLLVFAFASFAFAAVESCFAWLILYRFHTLIQHMASQSWELHQHTAFTLLPALKQQGLVETTSTSITSSIFGIVGITALITQSLVAMGVGRQLGEHRMASIGSLLLTFSLFGIAFSPSIYLIKILSGILAFGNSLLSPSLSALISHAAGPEDRGTISGAQQGLSSLARIVAPPVNNYFVLKDTRIPFFSSGVLMSVAFFMALKLQPIVHKSKPVPHGSPTVPTPEEQPEPAAPVVH